MTDSEGYGYLGLAQRRSTNNHPYTPSIASTASSSLVSIFSAVDGQSSQSSASSSVRSAALSWDGDSQCASLPPFQKPCGVAPRQPLATTTTTALLSCPATKVRLAPAYGPAGSVVPPELRLHPRRTHRTGQLDAGAAVPQQRVPPPLIRQCERKDNFVENLVDTTSQMIEVIWPLSVVPCGRDAVLGGKNLIGLRTFIQEVLKRSKTSYSTLQVALYYLVLIKPRIPKMDFTKEQGEDSHAARAMQCGRRMFLAALILASKYLQDRNYSARAWSKISGLKIAEINSNEIAFVSAVDWKLHIPEPLFQRWTDIVLKYSLSAPTCPTQRASTPSWRSIIACLTPALDNVDVDDARRSSASPQRSPRSLLPMSPPPTKPQSSPERVVPVLAQPDVMEPRPRANADNYRFPPISPRIPQLPTPQMTPQSGALGPPAASANGACPARSAMRCAMKQAQQVSMLRCTVDAWPETETSPLGPGRCSVPVRRSSEERSTTSLVSSPESMVSDTSSQSSQSSQSSRSSRSSSISSVASAAGALPQPPRLAVQATRRCATMQMSGKPNGPAPIIAQAGYPGNDIWSNVNPFAGAAEESYIRGKKEDPEATAAFALRELALAGAEQPEARSCPTARPRKRERPSSGVDSRLQEEVEALLKRQDDANLSHTVEPVAVDPFLANTFLLNGQCVLPTTDLGKVGHPTSAGTQIGARKRVCFQEQTFPNRMVPPARGPGMWNSVL